MPDLWVISHGLALALIPALAPAEPLHSSHFSDRRVSHASGRRAADVVVAPYDPDEVARKITRAIRKSERKK